MKYLHNISSNDIKSLAEGRGTLALLLNPQGHILAELEVYALPEKLLVLSHASQRERTVATLKKYVIGSQVQIEDLTEQLGSIGVEGPRAAEVVRRACGIAVDELADLSIKEITMDAAPCYILRRSHFGEMGAEIIAAARLACLRCGGNFRRRCARQAASRSGWRRFTRCGSRRACRGSRPTSTMR